MKERVIQKQRTTTLAACGHHQILGCLATFSEISLASLFFRGLAWRIVTLAVLRCQRRRYHPQSKPAAHVAPCTSLNVGDEGSPQIGIPFRSRPISVPIFCMNARVSF